MSPRCTSSAIAHALSAGLKVTRDSCQIDVQSRLDRLLRKRLVSRVRIHVHVRCLFITRVRFPSREDDFEKATSSTHQQQHIYATIVHVQRVGRD